MFTRCESCPVPRGVPCIGIADWCADLPRWGNVVLARSLGLMADEPCPESAAIRERARDCPRLDRPWGDCLCGDRRCGRDGLVVSHLDCLLCQAGDRP